MREMGRERLISLAFNLERERWEREKKRKEKRNGEMEWRRRLLLLGIRDF
jgi:hypothetical protein